MRFEPGEIDGEIAEVLWWRIALFSSTGNFRARGPIVFGVRTGKGVEEKSAAHHDLLSHSPTNTTFFSQCWKVCTKKKQKAMGHPGKITAKKMDEWKSQKCWEP